MPATRAFYFAAPGGATLSPRRGPNSFCFYRARAQRSGARSRFITSRGGGRTSTTASVARTSSGAGNAFWGSISISSTSTSTSTSTKAGGTGTGNAGRPAITLLPRAARGCHRPAGPTHSAFYRARAQRSGARARARNGPPRCRSRISGPRMPLLRNSAVSVGAVPRTGVRGWCMALLRNSIATRVVCR